MDKLIKINQNLILEEIKDYFIEIYENINEYKQVSFQVIFKDFEQIKNLIYLRKATIKDIKWFFSLDLFYILSDAEAAENRVLLSEIYNLLLNYSSIEKCKDFQNHASVLLENAKILEDKESCFLEQFCPILECAVPLALKQSLKGITELRTYIIEKKEPSFLNYLIQKNFHP